MMFKKSTSSIALATFAIGFWSATSTPAQAGKWYPVRNPYHNTSRSACLQGTQISTWELRRSWSRGRCWAYIANSRAEYNKYMGKGARATRQSDLSRRCKARYGPSFYWSSIRKLCVNARRALRDEVRSNRYETLARRACGNNNYIVTRDGYKCIRSARRAIPRSNNGGGGSKPNIGCGTFGMSSC